MRIQMQVHGRFPPKKDGASSMWGKGHEVENLIALRRAALTALRGHPPLAQRIRVELTLHVGDRNDKATGDLDNFITGVCDGLMAAAPGTPWHEHPVWSDPANADVRPDRTIAIQDDSQVVSIHATKIVDSKDAPGYEIVLSDQIGASPRARPGAQWSLSELRDELDRFEGELRSAKLREASVHTYVDRSRHFLRWLEGDYKPRSNED